MRGRILSARRARIMATVRRLRGAMIFAVVVWCCSFANIANAFTLGDVVNAVTEMATDDRSQGSAKQSAAEARSRTTPTDPESLVLYLSTMFSPEMEVRPTWFSNVYLWILGAQQVDKQFTGGPVITGDGQLVIGFGNREWLHLKPNSYLGKPNSSRVRNLLARMADEIPLSKGIHLGPQNKPVAFVVYSAVDCPHCIALERFLAKQNFHYVIFPGALASDWLYAAIDVWCSEHRAQRWHQLMVSRQRVPEQEACGYPYASIYTMGKAFGGGATPTIIFADGSAHNGWFTTHTEEKQWLDKVHDRLDRVGYFQ